MNEFVQFECACDLGYDKGVLKKTIENNIFTIFGNLNQKNSIVIRYHGILTENYDENLIEFNMFYFFGNTQNDKKVVKLKKCAKCSGQCYCATIDLGMNTSLNFGFFDQYNNYEQNSDKPFKLEIAPDPISNLMQKYGFEQNVNLPVIEKEQDNSFIFKTFLNSITRLFNRLFAKTTN